MNLAEYFVTRKVTTWLLIILCLAGGLSAYYEIGRLEDPEFTIKEAKIFTAYPGATPEEVTKEVTYHIENAVQQLSQLKRVESISSEGFSEVKVVIKDKFRKQQFPEIWNALRNKIHDMQNQLPPGAYPSVVYDDFGDVFGLYYALTGEGYSYRDLKDYADLLKEQLILVPGVRKITITGEQKEVVYVEISRTKLAQDGLSPDSVLQVLSSQNLVVDSGNVRVSDEYIRITPTGEFTSIESIGELLVSSQNKRLTYLKDVATVRRVYEEIADSYVYYNGKPALTVGISMLSGENVVAIGESIDKKLEQMQAVTPIGMTLNAIYDQPKIVESSVNGFMMSVLQALIIVVVVLLFFMGFRTGLIIGAILLITVAGTIWIMKNQGIELQRISLGALIIALGMLVDNAIVIAEGMLVKIKQGVAGVTAARDVVGQTIWPLLGGTVVGIIAFAAIGLSEDSTGEFAGSLFYVILYSLLLSWFTAIAMTPLLCVMFIKPDKEGQDSHKDPYSGILFQSYKKLLKSAIQARWFTMTLVIALFSLSVFGFGFVRQGFFPDSNTPMFYFDLWEIEGTDIRKTRDDILTIENFINKMEEVDFTATIVGQGASRYTLVYSPEPATSSYGQIIIVTKQLEDIPKVAERIMAYVSENYPNTEPKIKKLRIGPGRDAKIEARFSGPDKNVLRQLSSQAQDIFYTLPNSTDIRDDWRQAVKVIRPIFNEKKARQLGITRQDLADTLKGAFDGKQVGVYRDGIRLLPIIVLPPEMQRNDVRALEELPVWSPAYNRSVPISQIVIRFDTIWDDARLKKRDRQLTITASMNPVDGRTSELFEKVRPKIEAMPLPPGYKMEWGGEYEDSSKAQAGLAKSMPIGFLAMIIIVILLFGKIKQPLIIWLTVPLALIGVTAGLLLLNGAFDFMAILGALSLVGLLIKNAIVLIEQIDLEIEEGKQGYDAIIDSSVSRMRPVLMAASTTILGMIPLIPDVFFVNMAYVIMFGLGFASLLTLIVVPVLYSILFNITLSKK